MRSFILPFCIVIILTIVPFPCCHFSYLQLSLLSLQEVRHASKSIDSLKGTLDQPDRWFPNLFICWPEKSIIINSTTMSKAKITKPKVVQDSEEDSDSPVAIVAPKVNKKQKVEEKKVVKKQPVPASDSDEDSPVVEKKPVKQLKAETGAKKVVPKAKPAKESSSDSDLSEEEAPKKVVPKAKSPVQKPVVAKKKVVVPEPEADSESEEEAPKPKAKVAKVAQKVASPAQKPVATKKAVKAVEPESDSDEEEKPAKKAQSPVVKAKSPLQKPLLKPAAKAVEEDEEGEFEVIVKGLSFQAYDSDVKDFFEQCGNVSNVKLLTRDDGKSKGLAFVRFSKKSSFNKAIALDGAEHLGRNLKIEEAIKKTNDGQQRGFDNARPSNAGKFAPQGEANIETNTLFIGGLSFNSTVDSISEFFAQAGEVTSARIATDRETGKPRGFGYVEFQDVETAKKAYESLNGGYLDGRSIRLDSASQRDKPAGGQGGFRGGRGGFGGGRGGFGGNRGGYGGDSGYAGKKMTF